MARTLIGLIVGVDTRTVYSVVNPDDDADLDDPCHLQLTNRRGEPVRLVKLRRDQYHHPDNEFSPINTTGEEMTSDDVYHLIVRWYVEDSEIYSGPENIEGAV